MSVELVNFKMVFFLEKVFFKVKIIIQVIKYQFKIKFKDIGIN